ncbi:hypothetical protein TRFO_22224 [Tritrichomonas foetus]|uniref:Peptidase M28 domain-containing protein n=1 Tax=Tritrichomonas foetus TaxID=1144522 RepID=A0A1J4KI25_9EUKA|nr:hypothetical protein TRFO_22224 [Tritrichomonas foetus]|eukprot:OHT08989.1 hypothetical protein TRFO_22224 [Tritrichomonas foetus]
MESRRYFSPFRFVLGVILVLSIQNTFYRFLRGGIFNGLQSKTEFNTNAATRIHQILTQKPRNVNSAHYNNSVNFIFQTLTSLSQYQSFNGRYSLSFSFDNGNISSPAGVGINHFQGSIRSIIFKISVINSTNPPILLSAHLDSHPNTVGSYDDAINAAAMVEVAESILKSEKTINNSIIFVFLGSEENGLHGSTHFMQTHADLQNAYVLNLEALGSGRPFGLIWKANKSSSVIRAFSKTVGGIIATFFTDVKHFGLLKSRTDLEIYEKHGLTGAMSVYFGNPAVYHTLMDSKRSTKDIEYSGKILTDFLLNFNSDENETDVVAFGISPFVIIINRENYQYIAYSIALISISSVFLLKFHTESYLRASGSIFGLCLGYLFFETFLHMVNPLSYASDISYWFVVLIFYGVCIFLILELYEIQPSTDSWIGIHIILDSLLLLMTANYDISILFILALIPQLLLVVFHNAHYIVHVVLVIFQTLPISFAISLIYPLVVGYMDQARGHTADMLPFILIFFYCVHLCFALMPIATSKSHNEGIQYQMELQVFGAFGFCIIFMLTCMKPKPYSNKYPLLVSSAEYIKENLSSTISMMPIAGERVMQGLSQAMVKYDKTLLNVPDFHRIDYDGPAYVQAFKKVELPKWLDHWPEFDLKETGAFENERIINFIVHENNTDEVFESVSIVAHCPDGPCITKANENENLLYKSNEEGEHVCILRFTPVYIGLQANITVNTHKKVHFDVLFQSFKSTKERNNFKKLFKNYVFNYAKSGLISETVFTSKRLV